ncbi:hypothetical protein LB506_011054 [Fusarium annulatum]|nr:hypothetical protein LB506_011054 [Fusarium annulatum]
MASVNAQYRMTAAASRPLSIKIHAQPSMMQLQHPTFYRGFPHASPVNVATGHFAHDKVSASIFQAASAIPLRLQAFLKVLLRVLAKKTRLGPGSSHGS